LQRARRYLKPVNAINGSRCAIASSCRIADLSNQSIGHLIRDWFEPGRTSHFYNPIALMRHNAIQQG
jgi:hypothetical protein